MNDSNALRQVAKHLYEAAHLAGQLSREMAKARNAANDLELIKRIDWCELDEDSLELLAEEMEDEGVDEDVEEEDD